MRIERRGAVVPLTPRVIRFLVGALDGQSLDSKESSEQLRPDYICLGGRLAVEIKTLEEDATTRLDNFTDDLRLRDDWPQMMGSAPLHAVLKNMGDSENLQKKALDRIGRAIITHIRKANKQLRAYAEGADQKNLVKLLILINEDHEIYEPQVATFAVQKALRRQENGNLSYADVDAVFYLTERHAIIQNNVLAFPIICIEGDGIEIAAWKRSVLDDVINRWWKWSGHPVIEHTASINDFITIEHIPNQMPRYEQWELDYRRKPYMAHLADEQLRDIFDEIVLHGLLAFHKDSPYKPSHEETTYSMERMSHIRVEMSIRGIPVTKFAFDPQRAIVAAKRMRLTVNIMEWLGQEFGAPLS
jgi:hypothetical protein